jgi:hypothetical protein
MRFCDIEKVGVFCDTYVPRTEKRKSAEVKVLRLTLRIQPLTVEVAAAIDALVKRTLFRGTGDLAPFMHEVTFVLETPRQQLAIYASRDTDKPTLLFDQVQIGKLRARREKVQWAFVFKVTFGPVGPTELAYVNEWFGTQRFVSFDVAQGQLFDGDDDVEEPDEPEVDGAELAPRQPGRGRTQTH